ncbi:class I glutamine amidotransferase-like protein [Trametes cingulata]|nr:class I glutamine amidotransferase-like protein [Trametes cingulata]
MSASSNSRPYKIAVLLCDTPLPAILASQGDYGAIFETLFRNSLQAVGDRDVEFVVDAYDVRNEQVYPKDVDQYDAVLLTGSAASAYENLDWINKLTDYVRFLAKEKPHIRLIGICFGHQIIARALGGECVPNDGKWEVGITEIDLTDIGQRLLGVSKLNLEQMHRDHVPAVPPSFHLLGSTSIAPNQGMVELYPDASPESITPANVHIFTVQGHPEFHKSITEEIVKARHSTGVLNKDIVDDYASRADWRNDGPSVVGKTLWEILRASRAEGGPQKQTAA